MIKTKHWVIGLSILALLLAGLLLWQSQRAPAGTIANIYQNGVCIRSIDLTQVTQQETILISDESGENTILVEPGRICIQEADCPDQVCVSTGWISDSAKPIVCLPHKLVIRIEDQSGAADDLAIDTVSQ